MKNLLSASFYMYSDVPAGEKDRASSLGQRVIAFVILTDTAKLAFLGCAILYSHKKYSESFSTSGQQRVIAVFKNLCQSDEARAATSV